MPDTILISLTIAAREENGCRSISARKSEPYQKCEPTIACSGRNGERRGVFDASFDHR